MAQRKRKPAQVLDHEVGIDVDDSSVWMRPDVDIVYDMPSLQDEAPPSALQLRFAESGPHSIMFVCDQRGNSVGHIAGSDLARFLERVVERFNRRPPAKVVCISSGR